MGKVTEELGPTLLAFLGEVLYRDLSNSTTVAEATGALLEELTNHRT